VLQSRSLTNVLAAGFCISLAQTGGYVHERAGPPGRSQSISGPHTPRLAGVARRGFYFAAVAALVEQLPPAQRPVSGSRFFAKTQ